MLKRSSIIYPSNQSIVSSNKINLPQTKNRKIKLAGFLAFASFLLIVIFFLGFYLGANNNQPEIADNPVAVENPDLKEPVDEEEPIIQNEPEKIEAQEQQNGIYLDEMALAESTGVSTNDTPTDVTGKQYFDHYLTITDDKFNDGHIKVYLGGKYTQLSGVITIEINTEDQDAGIVTIKSDDNELYSTGMIPKSTSPLVLSQLDISGCEWLSVDVKCDNTYLSSKFRIVLSDFILS